MPNEHHLRNSFWESGMWFECVYHCQEDALMVLWILSLVDSWGGHSGHSRLEDDRRQSFAVEQIRTFADDLHWSEFWCGSNKTESTHLWLMFADPYRWACLSPDVPTVCGDCGKSVKATCFLGECASVILHDLIHDFLTYTYLYRNIQKTLVTMVSHM